MGSDSNRNNIILNEVLNNIINEIVNINETEKLISLVQCCRTNIFAYERKWKKKYIKLAIIIGKKIGMIHIVDTKYVVSVNW